YTHTVGAVNETSGAYELDCSDFLNLCLCKAGLLDVLASLGGKSRPDAIDYYDLILAGGKGIERVCDLADIRHGDIVAVSYGGTGGCNSSTGHVAVVGGVGHAYGALASVYDAQRGRYDVPVLDATSTPVHTSQFLCGGAGSATGL